MRCCHAVVFSANSRPYMWSRLHGCDYTCNYKTIPVIATVTETVIQTLTLTFIWSNSTTSPKADASPVKGQDYDNSSLGVPKSSYAVG